MTVDRLISSDSHVNVTHEQVKAHLATKFHADYDKAVRMLAPATGSLVTGGSVTATWLPDGRMWYRTGAGNAGPSEEWAE